MNVIEAVKKLNGSFSFGNQVLYDMCSNVNTDISKPAHLADMIWLIGRAYAASPERRTYGYEKDANGKVKKDANDKWVPLWKATNADDGKGGYFISIAKHITRSSTFAEFKEIFDNLKNSSYVYDGGDNDIQMLCNGVCAVNLYNYLIREASEEFDGLNDKNNPDAVKAKEAKAHCKNQISFFHISE